MNSKGLKIISELKTHIVDVMNGIDECKPDNKGVSYREIEELAGLELNLSAQDGWLTWSILSKLNDEGIVIGEKRGRRIYWKLANKSN